MAYNEPITELGEGTLVSKGTSFREITEIVSKVTEQKAPRGWWILFGISATFTAVLGATVGNLVWTGFGVWGNNSPVAWAWDITNFVWWIGRRSTASRKR